LCGGGGGFNPTNSTGEGEARHCIKKPLDYARRERLALRLLSLKVKLRVAMKLGKEENLHRDETGGLLGFRGCLVPNGAQKKKRALQALKLQGKGEGTCVVL